MSVLVVDDKQENIAFLERILSRVGFTNLRGVVDAREVETLLPEIHPDLVLLDLRMPHLDGHQVLDQIMRYAAGRYLPVLVLTADSSRQARDRALSAGARDFLTKPLDVAEVTLRVANLLETRQLYQDLWQDAAQERARAAGAERDLTRMRQVIDNRSLRIAIQPVRTLVTGEAVGYEALSRFDTHHPRGPAGWFEDADSAGLGIELERLAAELALLELPHLGATPFLAVNLSPASVLRLGEDPLVDRSLASRLVVELTEHVPVQDYSSIARALVDLRAQGGRLAADDLGSGYAGFRHLVALEPDIIKLDISLVRGIHQSRAQRALTSALQAFADDMGATVIAEGIEERAELDVLADLGVPWGQGYHLGRPVVRE
jgi:EAL domain-containing protein (putative c-di-GMP-specific phosphodiesterase class I)/AmiR/NasT family two-component response regulator